MAEGTISKTYEFVIWECSQCGVPYAYTRDFIKQRKEDGRSMYCPNGHSSYYPQGPTKEETLGAEVATLKDRLKREAEQRRRAEQDAEHFKNSRNAYKGKVTHLRKEIAAGKCPCCGKEYKYLARHMAHEHPEFNQEDAE